MHAPVLSSGNLLINGKFLRGLWSRLGDGAMECPAWAQTFAADRWCVRHAAPSGVGVWQACSMEIPEGVATASSLELQGEAALAHEVFTGQNIEAEEAPSYRRRLRFSAWLFCEHPTLGTCDAALEIGSPTTADLFDSSVEMMRRIPLPGLPVKRWTHVELPVNASAFRATGLRVELGWSPKFLRHPAARVRLTDVSLASASSPMAERPPEIERLLARRFFQRHDGSTLNAIGRALTVNPHELFFQFTFPEMRTAPACTLTHDNADLCVFSGDGQPQSGFVFDTPFAAKASVVIRATKRRHQLRDGYLAFRNARGAILLEAEL